MTPKEQARLRRRIAAMSPGELVAAHSEAMITVELIWGETAKRLCAARTGETCTRAVAAAMAEGMMFDAKSFHRKADVLAAQHGDLLPDGSRVAVSRVGSR